MARSACAEKKEKANVRRTNNEARKKYPLALSTKRFNFFWIVLVFVFHQLHWIVLHGTSNLTPQQQQGFAGLFQVQLELVTQEKHRVGYVYVQENGNECV